MSVNVSVDKWREEYDNYIVFIGERRLPMLTLEEVEALYKKLDEFLWERDRREAANV